MDENERIELRRQIWETVIAETIRFAIEAARRGASPELTMAAVTIDCQTAYDWITAANRGGS